MDLSKKINALIHSKINQILPDRGRRHAPGDDPDGTLKAIREALAEVETREQKAATLLKEAQQNLDKAVTEGNREEERAQRRMVIELETQLNNESRQAIALSQQLAEIEATIAAEAKRTQQTLADLDSQMQQSHRQGGSAGGGVQAGGAVSSGESLVSKPDDDTASRISRLSE